MYCDTCHDLKYMIVVPQKETIRVKDEVNVTVRSSITKCPRCGSDIWDNDLGDMDLIRAFKEYERITGKLIQPDKPNYTDTEVIEFLYPFKVFKESFDGHNCYVCESRELKGCVSQGDTKIEALRQFAENEIAWIEGAKKCRIPIPIQLN